MRVEALRGLEGVRAVAAGLEGRTAWLVGGVVRDALIGRELGDVDVAVAGDAEAAARSVGRMLRGPVFPLSQKFGGWRAIDGNRRFRCDVSPLQGDSIDADLARRDFTVNAIALPITVGAPIDPHDGLGDIDRRVLRVLGPEAYADDPLRALRLMRLSAELGFEPDAETERLTAAIVPRLTEPSAERVFVELRRTIAAPGAVASLELGRRTGVLATVLPELTALEGVEQSRFHHRDVYGHTLEVLSHAIEIAADPAAIFGDLGPQVASVLAEPLADGLTRGEALRLGALFHDVAKPATRGERSGGGVSFVGHDSAGDEMVGAIFRRMHTSERLRSYVGKLTRQHLVLGFLVHEAPLSGRAVHGYLRRCEPVEVEVTVLSCADRLATRGEGQQQWIAKHLALARDVMEPALHWRLRGPPRPPLRGDELGSALGIAPGPEVGKLLCELEAAVYAGEVDGRDEALELVRRVHEDGGR